MYFNKINVYLIMETKKAFRDKLLETILILVFPNSLLNSVNIQESSEIEDSKRHNSENSRHKWLPLPQHSPFRSP